LRDPERGAITQGAFLLRLLNDRALCEVYRRLRLSRAAKRGLSRGGVGLFFFFKFGDLALNFLTAPNFNRPCSQEVYV
jgi:hypothetical protein